MMTLQSGISVLTRFFPHAPGLLRLWFSGLAVAVLLSSTPWWLEIGSIRLLTEMLCVLALAQMWNLLAGYTGLFSLGQQAFLGIGAYTLVAIGLLAEWPLWSVLLAAPVCGAVLAVPAGFLVFRLRGVYFAVGTWVVAEVVRLAVAAVPQMSGGSGVSVAALVSDFDPEVRTALLLLLSVAAGVGGTIVVRTLLSTRWGLALRAVRDSEIAAESLGVSVSQIRWWVWIGCAAFTAFVGSILFLMRLRVSPDSAFSIEWTTLMLFAVVVGGIGTAWGPVLGTALYFVLREWLADWGSGYLLLLGTIIIITTLIAPRGWWVWLVQRVHSKRTFARASDSR